MQRLNVTVALASAWIALLLILILAACGTGNAEKKTIAERFVAGLPPTLIVENAPPCDFPDWAPYYNIRAFCAETVYDNVTSSEAVPALMSIAFADDGTLYMVQTAFGEIWAQRDMDGDQFFDNLTRVAGGLTLPTGIAVHDGALYVVSVDGITRLDDPDGDGIFDATTTLVDDLPSDNLPGRDNEQSRTWPGSIGIGPDGRLYVSIRAATSPTEPSTFPDGSATSPATLTGFLASYALDGSDEQIVATGFRDPADFAWNPETGDLWVVDSGRSVPDSDPQMTPGAPPDELNRIDPSRMNPGQTTSIPDYGYPDCDNGYRTPDPAQVGTAKPARCDNALPPAFTFFDVENHPAGIAFYTSEAIPFWTGSLLVAQHGSWDQPEPAGYAVIVVPFNDEGKPTHPLDRVAPRDAYQHSYDAVSKLSLLGMGFFPYHPVDVAVSPEGWIYIALEEGRILRFRPRPKADEAIPSYLTAYPKSQ